MRGFEFRDFLFEGGDFLLLLLNGLHERAMISE
jgi:hypothetical protein